MIKHYTFTYDITSAEASFKVDTEIFTADTAKATLEFFSWDYDKEGFAKIDGSKGIELMTIWGYEFDDSLLDMTVVND